MVNFILPEPEATILSHARTHTLSLTYIFCTLTSISNIVSLIEHEKIIIIGWNNFVCLLESSPSIYI